MRCSHTLYMPPTHIVYTDGSCLNNGTSKASAGIGVFFGVGSPRNISRRLTDGKNTNNTAEIKAILALLDEMKEELNRGEVLIIHTDSIYAIRACGEYGTKMSSRGWKTSHGQPIPNAELVKTAWERCQGHSNIHFVHVPAHTGGEDPHSVGNSWADKLAVAGAGGKKSFMVPPNEVAPTRRNSSLASASSASSSTRAPPIVSRDYVPETVYVTIDHTKQKQQEQEPKEPFYVPPSGVPPPRPPKDTIYAKPTHLSNNEVVWLNVPFSDKDKAKSLGAWWNPSVKKWFVPTRVSAEKRADLVERWGS